MIWIALGVAILSLLLGIIVLTLLSRLSQEVESVVKAMQKRLVESGKCFTDHVASQDARWDSASKEQENNVALLVALSQRLRPLEGRARNLDARRKSAETPPGYVPPEARVNDYWSIINGKRVRTRGD